jgi:hypothetical protein
MEVKKFKKIQKNFKIGGIIIRKGNKNKIFLTPII